MTIFMCVRIQLPPALSLAPSRGTVRLMCMHVYLLYSTKVILPDTECHWSRSLTCFSYWVGADLSISSSDRDGCATLQLLPLH